MPIAHSLASVAAFCVPLALTLLFPTVRNASGKDVPTWPQWRGVAQNGVAEGSGFPVEWSESNNISWKRESDGIGGSTPVIADGKIFFTAGIDGNNTLLAIDSQSGDQLWNVDLGRDRGNKHRKGSGSNPSPVTDGESVFAYFRSGDLACVGMDGQTRWQVNLQEQFAEDTLWWDLGSSPTLINNLVVIVVMQSDQSYLAAFDRSSGDLAWKVDRKVDAPEEAAHSYTTPIALPERNLIAVMGADYLTLNAAEDGKEAGRVGGFNPEENNRNRSISSPVVAGDLIVCPYSRGNTVTCCRISDVLAGKGRESVVWFRDEIGSDVPTPAIKDGRVYLTGDKGEVSALDLESGETIWTVSLPKSRINYSSSPLVAGDYLYVTAENAVTSVIGPLSAEKPEIISRNELADDQPYTVASPVPLGNDLIQRTRNAIYRIGSKD